VADVRRDARQDVVTGQQHVADVVEEADVTRGVARRPDVDQFGPCSQGALPVHQEAVRRQAEFAEAVRRGRGRPVAPNGLEVGG